MIKKTQNKIQRICQKHFVSRLNSNNETTSTTSSTQLIDPTEKEITAAKAAGEKAYSETGRSQTFSTVAATANFNGHTIPDGYTVIYAKDGVIVAVNGSMSADKTALQGVTKAIAFIDNRPDIHNLFIGSTVMVLLSHSQKVSIWGWLPLEIRSIQLHPMRIKVILLHPQHGEGFLPEEV